MRVTIIAKKCVELELSSREPSNNLIRVLRASILRDSLVSVLKWIHWQIYYAQRLSFLHTITGKDNLVPFADWQCTIFSIHRIWFTTDRTGLCKSIRSSRPLLTKNVRGAAVAQSCNLWVKHLSIGPGWGVQIYNSGSLCITKEMDQGLPVVPEADTEIIHKSVDGLKKISREVAQKAKFWFHLWV